MVRKICGAKEKTMIRNDNLPKTQYKNPVLYGDYSDPDAIRVGSDYYMVSSSFSNSPAIPVLHSKDLINWKVINYVCPQIPEERYFEPTHGCGVWAPSLRYHNNLYYCYFPMPDEGIYVSTTPDITGKWSDPVKILSGAGYIDPCPFWDDDRKAYLICAAAFSRCGRKSILLLTTMSEDGLSLTGEFRIIYDANNTENETLEGPKLYKRNGFYYIFAPAGGVKAGHQVVLRSRNIYGPYECRIVLKQGKSDVNGPHQGAWVDTLNGENYFLHFQDVYAGGRIVHMQPLTWVDDWPVIGSFAPGDSFGEPVTEYAKPAGAEYVTQTRPDCDDSFQSSSLGLQWQWNANYENSWYEIRPELGMLLMPVYKEDKRPLSDVKNLLLQKWPAPEFDCETVMDLSKLGPGCQAGIVSLGQSYAGICVSRTALDEYRLCLIKGYQHYLKTGERDSSEYNFNNHTSHTEETTESIPIDSERLKDAGYLVTFRIFVRIREYRNHLDRTDYLGREQWAMHIPSEEIILSCFDSEIAIPALAGRWVGVKNGVFCFGNSKTAGGPAVVKSVKYKFIH